MIAEPLALYVHWPFCVSKCPYCDFNSHVRHTAIDEARYVRAFAAEIAATAARVPGRTVSTIFFGGGTPSLMQPATVAAILDEVARCWTIAPDVEITLEANPTSVEALGGAPGIQSARWAGESKDFAAAMARIERELRAIGGKDRRAHFVAALCVAWPDGHVEEFESQVNGLLVWPPRGTQGFGYDPMFQPDGHARTFGEMPSEEKHGLPPRGKGLSHRARAFAMLAEACL